MSTLFLTSIDNWQNSVITNKNLQWPVSSFFHVSEWSPAIQSIFEMNSFFTVDLTEILTKNIPWKFTDSLDFMFEFHANTYTCFQIISKPPQKYFSLSIILILWPFCFYFWLLHYTCGGFCKTSYHLLISLPPTNLPNTLKIHTGENKIDR